MRRQPGRVLDVAHDRCQLGVQECLAQLAGGKGVSVVRGEREDEAVTDRCCLEVRVGLGVRIGGVRLTPDSGQVVVWSGGLGSRLVGLSGQVVFVL